MDQVTKDSIRHLQAYLPQERDAISRDEQKLSIRRKDLETLSETLRTLLKETVGEPIVVAPEIEAPHE